MARKELAEAEKVQAESHEAPRSDDYGNVVVAAIDDSPHAGAVVDMAARLAARDNRTVHVVHVREDAAEIGEDPAQAEALVQAQVAPLENAVGKVLTGTTAHGDVGLPFAEYANEHGARVIVIGAPSHGGRPALMDASAGQELWRHAKAHIMIVNPAYDTTGPQPVGSHA